MAGAVELWEARFPTSTQIHLRTPALGDSINSATWSRTFASTAASAPSRRWQIRESAHNASSTTIAFLSLIKMRMAFKTDNPNSPQEGHKPRAGV